MWIERVGVGAVLCTVVVVRDKWSSSSAMRLLMASSLNDVALEVELGAGVRTEGRSSELARGRRGALTGGLTGASVSYTHATFFDRMQLLQGVSRLQRIFRWRQSVQELRYVSLTPTYDRASNDTTAENPVDIDRLM